MAIINLFSKRQKIKRGEFSDVFIYDKLPQTLKVQIVNIIQDAFGKPRGFGYGSSEEVDKLYTFLHKSIAREYGVFKLGRSNDEDQEAVLNFLLQTEETEKAIDVIELSFKCIDIVIRENITKYHYRESVEITLQPDDAIAELNTRFKEHAIGYQFDGGEIIRIDSTLTHIEIVKPVLALLWDTKFKGANEEYLKAHEHYRHGRNKECLTECLKAFESVMKIICKLKNWQYGETDTAKKLIQVCFTNGLVPTFTQNQFTSLQNLLESGIPTIRNKLGGHGQGAIPQKVDDEMTRYGLNLTGTNILFLVGQSGLK
jgi:hypothetical protein